MKKFWFVPPAVVALAEVLSIFCATLMGFTILNPVHLLWINLITDCFPALALGMEDGEADIMKRPPRNADDGIFADGLGFDVAFQGIVITVLTLASYFIGHYLEAGRWEIVNSPDGMSMAFLTLSMVEIFHSFNMRSRKGSIFHMKHQNKYLWGAMALSFVLTSAVIYIPALSSAFGFERISALEYDDRPWTACHSGGRNQQVDPAEICLTNEKNLHKLEQTETEKGLERKK